MSEAHRFIDYKVVDADIGSKIRIPTIADRILVIGDLHSPYHHPDALRFLAYCKEMVNPDLVMCIGDETDQHGLNFHGIDPDLMSMHDELLASRDFLAQLCQLFPHMLLCHSNHGSLIYRRAKAGGIPTQMIKSYRDILLPDVDNSGWSWAYSWRIQTKRGPVLFKHQPSVANTINDAAHEGCNLVTGHLHGEYGIKYASSHDRLYWAMQTGCLIDKDAQNFAYGKEFKKKPIIGACAIVDGFPHLIPMQLKRGGQWVK